MAIPFLRTTNFPTLSVQGKIYGDGSELTGIVSSDNPATTLVKTNSSNWNSNYTTVNSNSATTWNYQGSDIKAISGNWDSVYTTVLANSATWSGGPSSPYSTLVQIFTSSGTWVKPSGAKSVDVLCIAGGGGGASGRVNAGIHGGGGGAGGGLNFRTGIPASYLSAFEIVTVGAGGLGGSATSVVNSQNITGVQGGDSFFGYINGSIYNPWVFAGGGGAGAPPNGTSGSANVRNVNIAGNGGSGGGAAAGSAGSSAYISAAGGGGGGGANSTSWFVGGNGQWVLGNNPLSSGGQAATLSAEGGFGVNGTSMSSPLHAGGGGSGGCGAYTKNAGAGGNGGLYGGGGGGGGCQGTQNVTLSSGAGGNGAQGIVIITTYF